MGNIGDYLKRYRQRKEWTQEKMAKRLGLSAVSYWKIEVGYTDVNITRLEQIAHILEVTVPDILFETETGYKSYSSYQSAEREKMIDLQNQLIEKEKQLRWLKAKVTDLMQQLSELKN